MNWERLFLLLPDILARLVRDEWDLAVQHPLFGIPFWVDLFFLPINIYKSRAAKRRGDVPNQEYYSHLWKGNIGLMAFGFYFGSSTPIWGLIGLIAGIGYLFSASGRKSYLETRVQKQKMAALKAARRQKYSQEDETVWPPPVNRTS